MPGAADPRGHARTGLLGAAAALVALSAWGGAVGLIGGGIDLGAETEADLPFDSPVLGGIALALVVALPYTVLARRAWRHRPDTHLAMGVAGGLLTGWILVQVAFLGEVVALHVLYAAIGVATVLGSRAVLRSERAAAHRAGRAAGVDVAAVRRFLDQRRIAVVGASADEAKFGNTVYRALRDHGYDVVAVNPHATSVAGDPCHPTLTDVPGTIEGVLIMVTGDAAVAAVHESAARGVPRVWLFRGVGSPGSLSDAALDACAAHDLDVVAGACPFMFLEPVEAPHRVHHALRRLTGALVEAA